MPQLVAIAVAGAALWAGYKWVAREAQRAKEAMARAEAELRQRSEAEAGRRAGEVEITSAGSVDMKELPKLVRDPITGEFRAPGV